jgi:hypothetical protein
MVVSDSAYCTDVLGTAKISYGLALGGASQNPEERTDFILTSTEHDTGNLISVGGSAVNPVADEFDNHFGITRVNWKCLLCQGIKEVQLGSPKVSFKTRWIIGICSFLGIFLF